MSEWHDDFVNHIGGILGFIEVMANHPSANEDDKKGFDQIKMLLHSKEAVEILAELVRIFTRRYQEMKNVDESLRLIHSFQDQEVTEPLKKEILNGHIHTIDEKGALY